jgi:hypothetical protein
MPSPLKGIAHTLRKGLWGIARGIRSLIGISGLTLFVLALQTLIIWRQAGIMEQQTSLMRRDSEIAEMQHELATRPNIVTSVEYRGPYDTGRDVLWRIENKGPYSVRDLRFTVLHFKKFVSLGWQDSIGGGDLICDVLQPGQSRTVNLKGHLVPYTITDRAGHAYSSVLASEFYVVSLTFAREVDSKRYLYLDPFHVISAGSPPTELRPGLEASSGPVAKDCTMEAYAVELAYEFYKRNPLPYPVELYNYHYLLGGPGVSCLETGPRSLRW